MKASDLFVQCLEKERVEYIFAVPGEENLDLLESIRKSKIELILTRHEQGAGFMAATYGRLTGKVGVCLSTLGPGATNLVTSVAYAQLGAMPILVITGQKPIKKSKQGRFQIIDVVNMMKPITKMAKQIVHGNNIPSILSEAFRVATQNSPGAVHVELPEDIAIEEVSSISISKTNINVPQASDEDIKKVIPLLQSAKNPMILIGSSANGNGIKEPLEAFIDKTNIPFFNTQMGKGAVNESKKQYIGTAALSADDYLHCAIDRADLIINIGHNVIEKPPFFMDAKGSKKVIHINFMPAQIDEIYFPQLEVIGDISHTIKRLADMVEPNSNWDMNYSYKVKDMLEEHIKGQSKTINEPSLITPQKLVSDIREVMPDDGIVTLDNGIYKIWFARNYKVYDTHTLLLDNALATMGAGLPSAMAAKLVKKSKKVLSVCGDGGFMMNSQELETAVRLNLDITVVVLRDNAYGMIKWKQSGMGLDLYGLDYGNPDFVKYVESYGGIGKRVNSNDEFKDILIECINNKGVHLIEVPIDYSENEKVLIDELKSKTCLI